MVTGIYYFLNALNSLSTVENCDVRQLLFSGENGDSKVTIFSISCLALGFSRGRESFDEDKSSPWRIC